ncbi:hypothetical protein ACTMS2_17430 [Micromonospora sp. SD12]
MLVLLSASINLAVSRPVGPRSLPFVPEPAGGRVVVAGATG